MSRRKRMAKRHKCGKVVQPERVGMHDDHKARRASLGFSDRDQVDLNEPINLVPWLSDEQKQAGLRYQSLKRAYRASIGIHSVGAIDMEGSGGRSPAYENASDFELKEAWVDVGRVLTDCGRNVKHHLTGLLDFNVQPRAGEKREQVCRGLNALARHWGLTTAANSDFSDRHSRTIEAPAG